MTSLTLALRDSFTMLGRELKHTRRFPLLLVGPILVPVVMLLLFVYILGGSIGAGLGDAARGASYVDFLVPGILMMAVAAGSGTTAIRRVHRHDGWHLRPLPHNGGQPRGAAGRAYRR
jgi:ABC-2 type transport system permease protein